MQLSIDSGVSRYTEVLSTLIELPVARHLTTYNLTFTYNLFPSVVLKQVQEIESRIRHEKGETNGQKVVRVAGRCIDLNAPKKNHRLINFLLQQKLLYHGILRLPQAIRKVHIEVIGILQAIFVWLQHAFDLLLLNIQSIVMLSFL